MTVNRVQPQLRVVLADVNTKVVESWRAAFGLTVTLVWVYVELLRILAILRGD